MPARVRAFAVHLIVSIFIALCSMLLVFNMWYPAPLHIAVGVTHVFLLVLMVDVVIGPLLTLLVYKVGKKTLVFDLTVIALLQASALCYGLYAVAEGRPAWLVFSADRFDLVRVLDIDDRKRDVDGAIADEYRAASWLGPQWVAAVNPADDELRNELVFESVFAGLDLPQRPDLYVPLSTQASEIKARLFELDELSRFNDREQVERVLALWPQADAWLPMMANVEPMVVLLESETAEVIAVVDLRPWL